METMTKDEALKRAKAALNEWEAKSPEFRAEVAEFFKRHGQQGIGWRPLCRMLFSGKTPEEAVKAYV